MTSAQRDPSVLGVFSVRTVFWLGLLLLTRLACPPLFAADPVFDAKGFDPKREYMSELPFEHIDPMTGNLLLTFTDLVLPGNAGFELRVQRTYNSKIFESYTSSSAGGSSYMIGEDSWAGLGWSLHFGRVLNLSTLRPGPVIEMPDGSRHQCYPHPDGDPSHYITRDLWTFERYASVNSSALRLPNGVVYSFEPVGLTTARATLITDPFGNQVEINYARSSRPIPDDVIASVVQRLGGGQTRRVTFTYEATLPNPVTGRAQAAGSLASMSLEGTAYTTTYSQTAMTYFGYTMLNSVQPPLGPAWRHTYFGANDWPSPFLLRRLQTPNGGQIDYAYVAQLFYNGSSVIYSPALRTRSLSGRDIVPGTWTYSYNSPSPYDPIESTVTAPCDKRTIYTFYSIGSYGNEMPWRIGSLARKRIANGSGNVLRDESYTWTASVPISEFPESGNSLQTHLALPETTTISLGGSSQVYTTRYDYDTSPYNANRANNFNDYRRANRIHETGERDRTTSRTFFYGSSGDPSFGTFIVDKVASETVTVGSESFGKSYTYDAANGFMLSQNVYGIETRYVATVRGNVRTVIDARNHRTHYAYDWGVASEIQTPEYTISRQINLNGTIASETRRGFTTAFAYDNLFRPTVKAPPVGNPITTEYDNTNAATITTRRASARLTTRVDGFGRAWFAENSVGIRTEIGCDACGRKVFESYPYQGTRTGTSYQLDALGRVTRATHPDLAYATYQFAGLRVTATDEERRTTQQEWSAWGNPDEALLVAVTDANSLVTRYAYNALGNLTVVDPPGQNGGRTFSYNARNQLESETHPENGTVRYTYDEVGNVHSRADSTFGTTLFQYDGNNRLTRVDRPAFAYDTNVAYDQSDNRTSVGNGYVSSSFSYDGSNRLTGRVDAVDGQSFATGYGYDGNDNLTAITYPSGTTTSYSHDSENRITQVNGNGRVLADSFGYHPSGAVTSFVSGNGTPQTFTYDDRYRLQDLRAGAFLRLRYGYSGVNNVETISDDRSGMGQSFDYDPLDRLTRADGPWGLGRFAYDSLGNRTSKTVGTATTTYDYEAATQRLRLTRGAEVDDFGYDRNGNTSRDSSGRYTYTPENQIETAMVGGVTTTYRYDSDNLRKTKSDAAATHYYLHGPGNQILSEFVRTGSGPLESVRDYVYAGTRLLAAIKPTVLRVDPTALTFAAVANGPISAAQIVSIATTGSEPIAWSATSNVPWLRFSPSNGPTPANLQVTVDPASLAVGTYDGVLEVRAPGASGSPRQIAVHLVVTAEPTLLVIPNGLSFEMMAGTSNPPPQTVQILYASQNVAWTAQALASWIQLSVDAGTTPATISVTAQGNALPEGVYSGVISVTADGATGSPQTVPVELTVTPAPGGGCGSDAWYCEPFDELELGDIDGQAGWITGTAANAQVVFDPRGEGQALALDARSRKHLNQSVDLAPNHRVDGSEISFHVMSYGVSPGAKQIAKAQFNTTPGGAWGKTGQTFGAIRMDAGMLLQFGRNVYVRLLDQMRSYRWYSVRVRYVNRQIKAYVDGVLLVTIDNPMEAERTWSFLEAISWTPVGTGAYFDLFQIRALPCSSLGYEICGNGIDDDCDGSVDETCSVYQCPVDQATLVGGPVTLDATGVGESGHSWSLASSPTGGADTAVWVPDPPNQSIETFTPNVPGPYSILATARAAAGNINRCETHVTAVMPGEIGCAIAQRVAAGGGVSLTAVGTGLTDFLWSLEASPPGGKGSVSWSPRPPAAQTVTFTPDVVGTYRVRASAVNQDGEDVSCTTDVVALPHGLRTEVTWNGAGNVDLHLVNTNIPSWYSPFDCYSANRTPAWGAVLDADKQNANGPENISLEYPELGVPYTVGVHNVANAAGRTASLRVFCGTASGTAPTTTLTSRPLQGTASGYCSTNEFWEAAQIVFSAPGECTVTPIDRYVASETICHGAPTLLVTPTTLDFGSVSSGSSPVSQTVVVTNQTDTGPLAWTANEDTSWLTLSTNSSVTPTTVTLFADPSNLPAGVHRGAIAFTAAAVGSPQVVEVSVTVTGGTAELVVEPSSLQFAAPTGDSATVYFKDEFYGHAVDSNKWNASIATSGNRWCAGELNAPGEWQDAATEPCDGKTASAPYGEITVADGSLRMAVSRADQPQPYIWVGPPSRPSPFPETGDFVLEFAIDLSRAPKPGGIYLVRWPSTDPVGSNSPPAPFYGSVFFNGDDIVVMTPRGIVSAWGNTFRMESVAGRYSFYVDNRLVETWDSELRPNAIWIGHPDYSERWDNNHDLSVDYVRVKVPSSGGVPPIQRTFAVRSTDDNPELAWQATESVPWLTLSSESGIGPSTVTATVDATGLAEGEYNETISVTAQGVSNSPIEVSVRLTVGPVLAVDPLQLEFRYGGSGCGPRPAPTPIAPPSVRGRKTSDLQSRTPLVPGAINPRQQAQRGRVAGTKRVPVARSETTTPSAYGDFPLIFEKNVGQTDSRVRFVARGSQSNVFLAPDEAVIALAPRKGSQELSRTGQPSASDVAPPEPAVFRMRLAGANPRAEMAGLEERSTKANYFIGRDPRVWRTNVPTFSRVAYSDVYPGIDLAYYGKQKQLEFDLVAKPGADPGAIRLDFSGQKALRVDSQGDLVVGLSESEVRVHRPIAYQDIDGTRRLVESRYVLRSGHEAGIRVARYDVSRPLVVDPVLSYSTYLGGSGSDLGLSIALGSDGAAYVAGVTSSLDFPTAEPHSIGINGNGDVFVAKISPDGSSIEYVTYLGGSGTDALHTTHWTQMAHGSVAGVGKSLAIESDGSVVVAGETDSSDFPTVNAFQPAKAGGLDVFLTKIDASGSAMIFSTYLGGARSDYASGVAVTHTGNVYVVGATVSADLPVLNAIQPAYDSSSPYGCFSWDYGPCSDGFVAKFSNEGALEFSTYLSGRRDDAALGVAVGPSGEPFITGMTDSDNFFRADSTPKGCGGPEAFVLKLAADGSSPIYYRRFGCTLTPPVQYTGQGAVGHGIAVDADGNAYVVGATDSVSFPKENPFQANLAIGVVEFPDAFITKLDPNGEFLYSTYLGGQETDYAKDVAVDHSGNVYVVGVSGKGFPSTECMRPITGSFLVRVNPDGSPPVYSTGFGLYVHPESVAVDSTGNAFVTGSIYDAVSLPIVNAAQPTHGGGYSDAFVAKVSPQTAFYPGTFILSDATNVSESAGSTSVTVGRVCGTNGIVSVDLSTADGTAVAGDDYEAVATTLFFADGDATPKTIAIPIIDDDRLECYGEDFAIGLSNPTGGAAIGSPNSGIHIDDNEGTTVLTQTFQIDDENLAEGPPWEATVDVPWLRLDAYDGTGPSTVTATADPTGLNAAAYGGTITVTSPAMGSPQMINVRFFVDYNGGGSLAESLAPSGGSSTVNRPRKPAKSSPAPARPPSKRGAVSDAVPAMSPRAESIRTSANDAPTHPKANAPLPLILLAFGGVAGLVVRPRQRKRQRGAILLAVLFALFATPLRADTIEYFHLDGIGNVRVVTDEAGNVIERHDYLPFGEECLTPPCAPIQGPNTRKFTGKERDAETGLDYFGARYYGSKIGRFTTVDPVQTWKENLVDPQRWNRYAYVGNDPVTRMDPDGKNWFQNDGRWTWNASTKGGYANIVLFQKTGHNALGSATGTLTFYEQDKIVAQSDAFSGGQGFGEIPEGTFMIQLGIPRGRAQNEDALTPDRLQLSPFYGLQEIAPAIVDSRTGAAIGDAQWEWGSLRTALNEPSGEHRPAYLGNYLHGKTRPGDYTHGCICERSERVLHHLASMDPKKTPTVPLDVRGAQ